MHNENEIIRVVKGCGNVPVHHVAGDVIMPYVAIQHDVRDMKDGVDTDECADIVAASMELDVVCTVDNLRGKARSPRVEA